MAATRTAAGALQSVVLALVILGLVILTVLALSMLINPSPAVDSASADIAPPGGSGGTETTGGLGSQVVDPTTPANSGSATGQAPAPGNLLTSGTSAAGMSCGRGVASGDRGPFFVAVDDSALWAEELAVGVDLIDSGGGRHARVAEIPASDGTQAPVVTIADSDDPDRYHGCRITAIQRGQQIILTGD